MTDDCEKYRLELKQKNIEIHELKAYNSACEDTLLDIELKFNQKIERTEQAIKVWKTIDPECDTSNMESILYHLKQLRKEIFKNEKE